MTDATTASAGPRGSYAKSAARRREIVEVATELFGRDGFRSTTMLQLAAACGISRTGLVHHFPTKESLLEAVLVAREENDEVRSARVASEHSGAAAALLGDLVALVRDNTRIPAIINLFAVLSAEASDASHPAHDYFVRRYRQSCVNIAASFEKARAEGVLADGIEPEAFAIEMIALMDGLQVQWLLDPERVDMAEIVRARVQSVITVPLLIDTRTSADSP